MLIWDEQIYTYTYTLHPMSYDALELEARVVVFLPVLLLLVFVVLLVDLLSVVDLLAVVDLLVLEALFLVLVAEAALELAVALVDLLDLRPDFLVEALAARSSSAFSKVTVSTDSPSGMEALILPCLM